MESRNIPYNVFSKELYVQQQRDFQDLMINGYNPDCFIVKDYDCSWGKSTLALKTLSLYKQKNSDKRVLYVTERKEQCTEYAEKVNKLFGTEVAKAIISGDVSQRKEYLQQYDIVFITHERYRRIGRLKNQGERDIFTDNRHLLIIDEKIEMCKEIKFSLTKNALLEQEIRNLAGDEAVEKYKEIVKSLIFMLNNTTKAEVYGKGVAISFQRDITEIESLIEQLKRRIWLKVTDERIFYIDFEDKKYQTILERIDDLREFYNGRCIMWFDKDNKEVVISVPNYSMDYWKLENNIVLDATASIDGSYSYNHTLFKIAHEEKVFKHINWTIKWAEVNTTTSGTNKYVDFPETTNNVIKEYLGEYQTLVFAQKYDDIRPKYKGSDEYEKIGKYKGTVTHKGVTNSSNEFGQLANFINVTIGYADEKSYVLKYLYYSKNTIENWSSKRRGNHREFVDSEIEWFKVRDMANVLYQAMKRINRNLELKSTIIFLCHYEIVRNIVIRMFNELGTVEHAEDIEKMFVLKNPTKIQMFKELCEELLKGDIPEDILDVLENEEYSKYRESVFKGKIPKCIFAKCLNMTSDSFGNNVLRDKQGIVKKFLKEHDISNPERSKTINFKGFE